MNMEELLSRQVDDAKYPLPLPAGTYYGTITAYKFDKLPWKAKDGADILGCVFTVAFDDVQASLRSELEEKGIDLKKKSMSGQFEIGTEKEGFLKDFLKGLDIPTAGRSFREAVPDARGKKVMVEITHYTNKKTGAPQANIGRMSALPSDE